MYYEQNSLETLGLRFGSFQMIIGVRSSSSSRSYMSLRLTAYQLSHGVVYHGRHVKPSREHRLLRAATLWWDNMRAESICNCSDSYLLGNLHQNRKI
ncbi:hypothetical protein BDV35DRAFT_354315 [Aspergillus flavus]|uniref:Uncharacterized protein n=1 Tax=Aspergillus flavus TaxID=5059 RepID=A0A5N6GWE0_ASPFL|nr:hypothetical protein BDV35DRAFT_354315 [Aspergillus flavus]